MSGNSLVDSSPESSHYSTQSLTVDPNKRILRVQLFPRENSVRKINVLFYKRPALHDLPFELMAEIFKNLHYIDVSPLKGVCREWSYIITEIFVFYPTGPNPFQLSIPKYYLKFNVEEGGRKHFDWNKMVLNFLGNVVPKDCGVLTLVVRVIEHKQCTTLEIEKQQTGFQTKVHEIAQDIGVKGYIQTQSIYVEEDETKRVFDVCAQGKPEILKCFLERVANITNNDGQFVALPLDVNFIYKSKIASSFIIKTTKLRDPHTQKPNIVSKSDEGQIVEQSSITTEESVFSFNSLTKTKSNLRNIVHNSPMDALFLTLLIENDCPPFILSVLTLYFHQEFKQSILDIIDDMKEQTFQTISQLYLKVENEKCFKPFWKELKKKCTEFLETNPKARHILACSSIKLF